MLANAAAAFADMSAGDGSHIPGAALSGIQAPVMVVEGELSPKLYHRVVGWLMRQIPNARRGALTGSGHAMMLDRPLELAGMLRDAVRLDGAR